MVNRSPAFPVGVLLAVRARLQEQRSSLLEEVADLHLRAGRHNELIEPLRTQIDGDPLRERPWGQLMVALARSGRRSDALATYRQLHRLLSGEVGVEPGPDLQDLHTRILRADRELLPTGARPPEKPVPQVVPRQLPAPPALFTGRTRELARLSALLLAHDGPAGTAVVTGTGGVGKTWLALRWAHDNLHHFPDGQLHVDLGGFGTATQEASPSAVVVRSLLPALGVKPLEIPAEPAAQFALYRSLTADRRLLVLLDNARDAEQVRPLLPGSAGCGVIVTSRHTLPGLVAAEGPTPSHWTCPVPPKRGNYSYADWVRSGPPPSRQRWTSWSAVPPGCRSPCPSWPREPPPGPRSRSRPSRTIWQPAEAGSPPWPPTTTPPTCVRCSPGRTVCSARTRPDCSGRSACTPGRTSARRRRPASPGRPRT
ncbi:hypothetical protein GCM10027614_21980 [Micromonospora vulcania]